MDKKTLLKKYKKKILTYAAISAIGVGALTGHHSYQENENGVIELVGELDGSIVKNTKLIHLTNNGVKKDEYIIAKYQYINGKAGNDSEYYEDIENGKKVYDFRNSNYDNFKVDIIVDNMTDYLYKYDMIQDKYTNEDIKELKENLLNDPDLNIKKSGNKQFIK